MGKNIYIGNLSFSASESSLTQLFSQHGTVSACRIVTDRNTGRAKGFAFVEMSTDEEAQKAISSINGQVVDGRALNVSEARPRVEKNSRDTGSLRSFTDGVSSASYGHNRR